jgi:hypothetical protein
MTPKDSEHLSLFALEPAARAHRRVELPAIIVAVAMLVEVFLWVFL